MGRIELKISKDFSKTPGPRFILEGEYSGELFRDSILFYKMQEAIDKGIKLRVNIDGTAGYATSFLEESFGGLIREKGLNYDDIIKTLEIISDEEEYLIENIFKYLKEAEDEKKK